MRTCRHNTSNLQALSVTRYRFGSFLHRMTVCICLVWPTDNRDFFFFFFQLCSCSLLSPLHVRRPICRLSSISERLFQCEVRPERVAGASETWHEFKGYRSPQTMSVSKPLSQMATECQGDSQSLEFTLTHIKHLYPCNLPYFSKKSFIPRYLQ